MFASVYPTNESPSYAMIKRLRLIQSGLVFVHRSCRVNKDNKRKKLLSKRAGAAVQSGANLQSNLPPSRRIVPMPMSCTLSDLSLLYFWSRPFRQMAITASCSREPHPSPSLCRLQTLWLSLSLSLFLFLLHLFRPSKQLSFLSLRLCSSRLIKSRCEEAASTWVPCLERLVPLVTAVWPDWSIF